MSNYLVYVLVSFLAVFTLTTARNLKHHQNLHEEVATRSNGFISYQSPTTNLQTLVAQNGNITIKWDVIQWLPDGYIASVTINNFQKFREIVKPGWKLGWTWSKNEVIWTLVGAQTREQGKCSSFKGNKPLCCKRIPSVVDLHPRLPIYQQVPNCCKGGVVAAFGQSAFQIGVGQAGNSSKTVKLPQHFTILAPGGGYTCGPTKIVPSTVFITLRGKIKVWMTWDAVCTYSQG